MVKIEVTSGQNLGAALRGLSKRLNDWRPLWTRIDPSLKQEMPENIRSQGSNIGENWEPLTPDWVRRKRGPRAGIETGRLLRMAGRHRRRTKRHLRREVRVPYAAAFHGKRAFVGMSQRLLGEIEDQGHQRVEKLLDRTVKEAD